MVTIRHTVICRVTLFLHVYLYDKATLLIQFLSCFFTFYEAKIQAFYVL